MRLMCLNITTSTFYRISVTKNNNINYNEEIGKIYLAVTCKVIQVDKIFFDCMSTVNLDSCL